MTKPLCLVLAVLAISSLALAQTVEGTWRGTTTGGTEVVLRLHVGGERVTGTMRGEQLFGYSDEMGPGSAIAFERVHEKT